MSTYVVFLILGLGAGAIYAVLALGLVVQQRGANILNFSLAAMMMMSSLTYAGVRSLGVVIFPIPGIPDLRVSSGPGPAWAAWVAALLVTIAIGVAADLLVFRWLRDAPTLSRVAAAVGVMLTLEAVAGLHYSEIQVNPPGLLPSNAIDILGGHVPVNGIYLAAIAIVLGVLLWAFFSFTTVGLAIRASAENERGAAIAGWSQNRLAMLTWVGTAVIVGVMGILVAPIAAQDPSVYTLLIIPGLAAALLARFRSFLVCIAAGLGVGIAQSVLTQATSTISWLPLVGIQDAVPFLLIIVVLAFGGEVLPARGALVKQLHPFAYAPRNLPRRTVILLAAASLLLVLSHDAARFAVITSIIGVLLALSIVVVTGYAGLMSLSQYAFAGLAAFMVSNFAEQWGVPFPFAPLLAVLCATVLGLLIGLSALRVRGVNLAIATLGVGAAVDSLLFRNPQFAGGYNGAIVPEPRLFGLDLGINAGHGEASLTFGFICLVIAALACLAVSNLRRTGTGRRMLAVRANERAAAAAGISVAQTKLLAFGISSFLAGLAGALLAYDQVGGLIPPDQFGPIASVVLLTTVFIGGVSTVAGAVIAGVAAAGGLLYYLISQNIQQFSQWQALVGGIGLILVAVRQPSGLAGYSIEHFRRSRLRHQRATAVAEPVVPARDTDATLGVD